MTKNSNNRLILFYFIIISYSIFGLVKPLYSQSPVRDTTFHPYHVNYWVTGTILSVGGLANYLGMEHILNKEDLSLLEIQSLDKDIINGIDSWALKQDPSKTNYYNNISDYTLMTIIGLPTLLMFDKQIKRDWGDMLLMYLETMSITTNIFEWSFFGPTFQHRVRPIAYYEQLTFDEKKSGNNRNSFYSGHVATAAASSFFMVKVYSDYHPEIGNNKYLLYAAAMVPPLVLGYIRMKALRHFPSDIMAGIGIGALCGILIPEFHRIQDKNVLMGLFTSTEGTGIAIKWQPNFLK